MKHTNLGRVSVFVSAHLLPIRVDVTNYSRHNSLSQQKSDYYSLRNGLRTESVKISGSHQ